MTNQEILKLALEVIQDYRDEYGPWCDDSGAEYAIKTLKEALAKQEQGEPVAYIRVSNTGHVMACAVTSDFYALPEKTLLYTTPQQHTWVGLTDEEMRQWWWKENGLEDCDMCKIDDFTKVVREVEAKLKEKNG